jgi:hypothetical protein
MLLEQAIFRSSHPPFEAVVASEQIIDCSRAINDVIGNSRAEIYPGAKEFAST